MQTFTRGTLNVFAVVIAIKLLHAGAPGVGVLTAAVGVGAVGGSLGASLVVGGRLLVLCQEQSLNVVPLDVAHGPPMTGVDVADDLPVVIDFEAPLPPAN